MARHYPQAIAHGRIDGGKLLRLPHPDRVALGEVLFQHHCNDCHATTEGYSAAGALLRGRSRDLVHVIVEHLEAVYFMPPWCGTSEEAELMTDYLMSINPPRPAGMEVGDRERGGELMEPQMLIDQASASALPAPFWFVQFFKCLGFTLHAVPMNLWYAGLPVALWLHLRGNEHARRFAGRLLQQMPVIVAIGVNLGVVPLLFVQLAYPKVFYPATILMAWFWLGIIGLLIPGLLRRLCVRLGPSQRTEEHGRLAQWPPAGARRSASSPSASASPTA